MAYYGRDGERKIEYKEDSTKGKSLIIPRSYKCDGLVQMWIDRRILATLNDWLEKIGYMPRSLTEVARKPLEMLVDHLIETGQIEMTDDTVSATEKIEKRYRVRLNKSHRGEKNLLHNTVLSGMREEDAVRLAEAYKAEDINRMNLKKRVDPDVLKRAVEIYNSLPNQKDQTKEEAMEIAKDSGLVVDKKGE